MLLNNSEKAAAELPSCYLDSSMRMKRLEIYRGLTSIYNKNEGLEVDFDVAE